MGGLPKANEFLRIIGLSFVLGYAFWNCDPRQRTANPKVGHGLEAAGIAQRTREQDGERWLVRRLCP